MHFSPFLHYKSFKLQFKSLRVEIFLSKVRNPAGICSRSMWDTAPEVRAHFWFDRVVSEGCRLRFIVATVAEMQGEIRQVRCLHSVNITLSFPEYSFFSPSVWNTLLIAYVMAQNSPWDPIKAVPEPKNGGLSPSYVLGVASFPSRKWSAHVNWLNVFLC